MERKVFNEANSAVISQETSLNSSKDSNNAYNSPKSFRAPLLTNYELPRKSRLHVEGSHGILLEVGLTPPLAWGYSPQTKVFSFQVQIVKMDWTTDSR